MYHSTPEHYSKMLSRLIVPQSAFGMPKHVVAVFPFSLDKALVDEDVRTRSPKLWMTWARCITEDRSLLCHFKEVMHTNVMTTFLFDFRHPRFANIPRARSLRDIGHLHLPSTSLSTRLGHTDSWSFRSRYELSSLHTCSRTDDMLTTHTSNKTIIV